MSTVRRYRCGECSATFPLDYDGLTTYSLSGLLREDINRNTIKYHTRSRFVCYARPGAYGMRADTVQCGPLIEEEITEYQDALEHFLEPRDETEI